MASITSAINDWLLTYEDIESFAVVNTEILPDETKTLALQRTGVTDIGKRYIFDTRWIRQYEYSLLVKFNSENNTQILDNLDFLDKFSEWLEEQNIKRNFPILEDKTVLSVNCENAITYEQDEIGEESIYYIQIYFKIRGGK